MESLSSESGSESEDSYIHTPNSSSSDEVRYPRSFIGKSSYQYEQIYQKPTIFYRVTGFFVIEFDNKLYPLVQRVIVDKLEHINGAKRKLSYKSHVVMILFYLHRGLSFFDIAPHFSLTEASTRRIAHLLIPVMRRVLERQIIWKSWRDQSRHIDDAMVPMLRMVIGIVDATEIQVCRPGDDIMQKMFYSGKKKKHTVKFQVVVEPISGLIMNVFGPVPGSTHDIKLFDYSGVGELLQRRERILADSGYQGLDARGVPCVLPIKKPRGRERTEHVRLFNSVISRHRVAVENVISRIKDWQILSQKWRGRIFDRTFLYSVFSLCCSLVNIKSKLRNLSYTDDIDEEVDSSDEIEDDDEN